MSTDRELLELAASTKKEAISLGLTRYFTGKPCIRGHFSERNISSGVCLECLRESSKKHYQSNRSQKLEKCAEYRKTNKEKISEYFKQYSLKNSAHRENIAKVYRIENAEKEKIRHIKYREENLEACNLREQIYRENNREKFRAKWANRRALVAKADGKFTGNDVLRIKSLQKDRCAGCSNPLVDFHADHVIPISKGGSNWPTNIQLLCVACNLKKHAKDPIKWANENGRLL